MAIFNETLLKQLRSKIFELQSSYVEELLVDGEAEVEVTFTVRATVSLDFNDMPLADRRAFEVREISEQRVLIEPSEPGEHIHGVVTEDFIHNAVHDFVDDELLGIDLDDYRVSVNDVEVEDFVVEHVELDSDSQEKLKEWNRSYDLPGNSLS